MSLPRARGDRPVLFGGYLDRALPSPRTRGSTPAAPSNGFRTKAFPAHAGIDPKIDSLADRYAGLPRARGDRPACASTMARASWPSPRTRGSTLGAQMLTGLVGAFPAHAGIDLARRYELPFEDGLPRARGDRPVIAGVIARRYGPSPRTRGSTRFDCGIHCRYVAFPAHAGIDLPRLARDSEARRLPRARGDRPGCISPQCGHGTPSPRTRGSTHPLDCGPPFASAFPAHAGIDPCCQVGTCD